MTDTLPAADKRQLTPAEHLDRWLDPLRSDAAAGLPWPASCPRVDDDTRLAATPARLCNGAWGAVTFDESARTRWKVGYWADLWITDRQGITRMCALTAAMSGSRLLR